MGYLSDKYTTLRAWWYFHDINPYNAVADGYMARMLIFMVYMVCSTCIAFACCYFPGSQTFTIGWIWVLACSILIFLGDNVQISYPHIRGQILKHAKVLYKTGGRLMSDGYNKVQAMESARNARWLVDEQGRDVRGLRGFFMNLHRRFHKFPKCIRDYLHEIIAIEIDANNEYHVMVARGRGEWCRVVLTFKREKMEILHYEPQTDGEKWEDKIKEWVG